MSAFVKKEIRLLLPGWLAIVALEILLPGLYLLWGAPDDAFAVMPVCIFFGLVILAVDSFGREFSLGTFASLMAQPMERWQIWRTKITILLLAAGLLFAAYFAGLEVLYHHALKVPVWGSNAKIIGQDFGNALVGGAAGAAVALAGGLWTALLLRQTAAAFWITFLFPLGVVILLTFFLPAKLAGNDGFVVPLLYTLAGLYALAGFWLARRLFHRVQDAAWTGGIIAFSAWRYFESRSSNPILRRQRQPFRALFKKEFQLHSIGLFCAGTLLVLHIGVFFLRPHVDLQNNSLASLASEFFWIFWLVMPLVIGCMAVAEERKLGVMAEQFCLPVSRRTQFVVKFVPAMVCGTLLGGVVPLILETVAAHFGPPNPYFNANNWDRDALIPGTVWWIFTPALAMGLTLIGFLASTLAKNFLQALTIAIITFIGCSFFWSMFLGGRVMDSRVFVLKGVVLWGAIPPLVIGTLVVVVFLPWLCSQNFSRFADSGRLWRRTLLGITGALLFVFGASAVVYHRAWEVFESAEPPHAAPKLSLTHPPVLQDDYQNVLVRWPDGRVWYDAWGGYDFGYGIESMEPWRAPWHMVWQALFPPLPKSLGPQQFLDGSNWVSASAGHIGYMNRDNPATGYLDTIGIKSNGTLWISSHANPGTWNGTKMAQYGTETNWVQVNRSLDDVMLLKTDGTLWLWRIGHFDFIKSDRQIWRTNPPQQIGTGSNWKKLLKRFPYAEKADGSVWRLNLDDKTSKAEMKPEPELDWFVSQNPSLDVNARQAAYLAPDGTLQVFESGFLKYGGRFVPVDEATHWVAVATSFNGWTITLKADGSLWQWIPTPGSKIESLSPARLGIHHDWVAISSCWNGVVALAADGSLWFWPSPSYFNGPVWQAPKQPQLLGNVLN